ncbi:CRAL-TRIO domain-containing protein [Chytriomyces cf. hyalinus JEL632]|nr:CRAL-TRIO domain-containing protein [Chytriomyces cf. hyalinus JEL632]
MASLNPIFTPPAPVPPRPKLTPEQENLVQELHALVLTLLEELNITDSDSHKRLLAWATPSCCRRYLTATSWRNIRSAADRLKATLQWRHEYKPDQINSADIEPEARSGRSFLSGFDKHGHPLLFLVPSRPRAADTTHPRQIAFSVFMLERAIAAMPENSERIALVIDYKDVARANATPLSVSLNYLNIFSAHYPETLALGIMVKPSWYLSVLLTMLWPFLDPVTKAKINFYDPDKGVKASANAGTGGWINILDVVDPSQLPVKYGGTFNFEYNHEVYWPQLLALKPAASA